MILCFKKKNLINGMYDKRNFKLNMSLKMRFFFYFLGLSFVSSFPYSFWFRDSESDAISCFLYAKLLRTFGSRSVGRLVVNVCVSAALNSSNCCSWTRDRRTYGIRTISAVCVVIYGNLYKWTELMVRYGLHYMQMISCFRIIEDILKFNDLFQNDSIFYITF